MLRAIDTSQVIVLILAAVACWYDLRTKHIPNLLTLGGAALALIYSLLLHGAGGLLISLGGWLTGVALFLPFFVLGGMGAGDVKLVGCLGAWLGPGTALWVALYSMIAGGAMALALALATGYLGEAMLNVLMLLGHWRKAGLKPLPALTLAGASRGPRLPYALPIAAGALAAIWLR
jgi:prepilin peptidase CpaA